MANAEATFSEAIDPATLSASTFSLIKQGAAQPLSAQIGYDQPTKKEIGTGFVSLTKDNLAENPDAAYKSSC